MMEPESLNISPNKLLPAINDPYYDRVAVAVMGIVIDIRRELRRKYEVDDPNSDNYRYRGLCDTATVMVLSRIKALKAYDGDFTAEGMHGEQRHSHKLATKDWYLEHTWLKITFDNSYHGELYVDPTSGQFHGIHPDIPDIYIERKPPKWYLPDSKNPYWNWSRFIRRKFNIDDHRHWSINIIWIIRHKILGKLNTLLRRLCGRE